VGHWLAGLPLYKQILLSLGCTLVAVELTLRRFAREKPIYKRWTHGIETLGAFWTAVILSIVYFFSVSFVSIGMKLAGKDLLDKGLAPEPTFWRTHEPNPLGRLAAVRHQF
jgi:hypothetical protein